MLTFWVSADFASIKRVIEKVMGSAKPAVPYRFVEVGDQLLLPQAGETILAMGAEALALLQKGGAVPKGRSVASLRGKTFSRKVMDAEFVNGELVETFAGVGHWMVTYTPDLIWIEADKEPLLRWDVRLAHRFHTTGSVGAILGKYGWQDDYSGVISYIEEQYEAQGGPVKVSLDLETMGLVPWLPTKHIVSVSLSPAPGYSLLLNMLNKSEADRQGIIAQLKWIMNSEKVVLVGANLKFDLNWLRVKWGLESTNFKFDTLLVGSLINENRSNSLNGHAKEYCGDLGGYDDPFNLTHDKGAMEVAIAKDPDGFLAYAGGDTDACLQVAEAQFSELTEEPCLKRFYARLLHPAARAFEQIEHRGMVVDTAEYAKLEKELLDTSAKLEAEALAMLPARLKLKHEDKGVTLSRSALIAEFLFTPMGLNLKPKEVTSKTGAPSTAKSHLMMFADHPDAGPFIERFREWNVCQKTLGTYVHGFLKHLRPDGRFHPTYMLFAGSAFGNKDDDGGTNTGRLSAIDPAVQTVPKHTKWAKKLRKCFPAPPGMRFWQADFSQGELRITADVANEETMIDAYLKGIDLHAVTGAKLAGYELEEFLALADLDPDSEGGQLFAMFRQRAKPANFGLLYGMGTEGFQEYTRVSTNGKLILTLEEAFNTREAFFDLYPALRPWHSTYKDLARAHGKVYSPLGRVRHLPLIKSKNSFARSKAERQAVNAPIQGCLSDMNIWAAAIMEQNWGGEAPDKLWVAGATHDSIYGYCPADNYEMWLARIVEVMSNLPLKETFDWEPKLGFPADIEVGDDFAGLVKYKVPA